MVPTSGSDRAGMRNLISEVDIKNVFKILKTPGKVSRTTWNRRFREFNDKLRTGSISDIAEVLRDLCCLRGDKDLSYGEKKMLDKSLSMLIAEISAASGKEESEILADINKVLPLEA